MELFETKAICFLLGFDLIFSFKNSEIIIESPSPQNKKYMYWFLYFLFVDLKNKLNKDATASIVFFI